MSFKISLSVSKVFRADPENMPDSESIWKSFVIANFVCCTILSTLSYSKYVASHSICLQCIQLFTYVTGLVLVPLCKIMLQVVGLHFLQCIQIVWIVLHVTGSVLLLVPSISYCKQVVACFDIGT